MQYDGSPAIRYMEYPVLTGLYQYVSMALAKTYTTMTKLVSMPIVAEVVMFFNIAAFGLALAWMATVWATARLSGRRIWTRRWWRGRRLLIFQVFTNFDALATAAAIGALLAWSRRKPVLAGALIGVGVALKLYPLLLLVPLAILAPRTGRLREVGKTAVAAVVTWLVVNLPVMVLFPRGGSEFFRLNTRRGDDMDSLYNVIKSFTAGAASTRTWVSGAAVDTQLRDRGAFRIVLRRNRLHRADRATRPRLAQLAFLVVAAFLLTKQGVEPAVLAVAGAVRALALRTDGFCWRG